MFLHPITFHSMFCRRNTNTIKKLLPQQNLLKYKDPIIKISFFLTNYFLNTSIRTKYTSV